ncbi:MAG TPA: PAS domain S-box protein [Terriglobales bacterium]|nr:PAS domain S-box protein [Terriglobales bacterium]
MKNSRRALPKTALQKEKVEREAPRLQKGSTGEDRELGRESSSQARIELAAIVESSDDAILSKNLDGIIHSWNKGAQRIYGYSAAEMIGRHVSFLVPPGYPDDTPEIMRRLRLGERIEHYETRRQAKNGTVLNVSLTISPVRDEKGTIIGASAIARDITERKRSEQELRQSRQALQESELRFRSLVQNSSDIITILGADGSIRYESPSIERILGYSPEELLDRNAFDLVHPDERARVMAIFQEHLPLRGSIAPIELRFRHKDGSWRTLEATGNNLLHEPGVAGIVVNSRDITERKRTEDVLHATEKLATTGRLAAAIAHEINNPLEGVTNLLYLLENHPSLDASARRYARMAQEEVARVARIARQTLAFYREPTMPVAVEVSELLSGLLELYAHKLQTLKVKLEKRLEPTTPITASPGEIRQVLSNLVGNALDAVPEGGAIKVHVYPSRDWRHPWQEGVRISIADTGHGIRHEHLASIFDPFFTTKGEKGTGLGLWVSHGIVQKYGGTIHVRSSVRPQHSGTCFSVFFPQTAVVENLRKPVRRAKSQV